MIFISVNVDVADSSAVTVAAVAIVVVTSLSKRGGATRSRAEEEDNETASERSVVRNEVSFGCRRRRRHCIFFPWFDKVILHSISRILI